MTKSLIPVLALVYLAFLPAGSCSTPAPNPIPPTEVDAGPNHVVADCSSYCDHLKGLPCSEGTNPKCLEICQKVLDANLIKLPIECVMSATTVKAAINCGAECK